MQRTFKRDLNSLAPLFEFTGDFAMAHQLDEPVLFAMNLSVEELFTNMVKYGEGDDKVFVALDVLGDDLVIELVHSGARDFDPNTAKAVDTKQSLEDRQPGGLGLQLVRSVMDMVSYEHSNGAAHIKLVKHLRGQ